MDIELKLTKNECDYILNALQFFQRNNLEKATYGYKNMKYKNVSNLFESKKFFENYIKEMTKDINEQIKDIDNISNKITTAMYD